MKIRILSSLWPLASWIFFVAAIGWPTLALIGRCVTQGEPPEDGFGYSDRQIGLMWRSLWLAATATLLCVIISLPAACAVGRVRRIGRQPLLAAALMVLLLSPPMVYAFGWSRLLPASFPPVIRCIGTWALWAWPIPALLIGTGWSRVGHTAHEAALLVSRPSTAFLRVAVPLLSRYVALAGLMVFILFLSDYGVPHACGLLVYSTELLGWAQSSTNTIDTLWPSLPSMGFAAMILLAIFVLWRRCASDGDLATPSPIQHHPSRGLTSLAILCFVLSWVLPIGGLAAQLASPGLVAEAWKTYATDLAWTIGLAALAGLAAVGMGLGLSVGRGVRRVLLAWAILFGVLPGALIGESLVAAYNHPLFSWIYDDWAIVALVYLSRFGWIGIAASMLAVDSGSGDIVAQAQTDGADQRSITRHIHLGAAWPVLLGGAGIVAALAVADIAASDLVRVPRFSPIAHILMEKFHRFEDGMLVTLSLWIVSVALLPAGILALAWRRWSE